MRAWYLIYSKPQQEQVALENLHRQGYVSYLPRIRGRRRRQGKYVKVVEPMFPRYLFVQLNDQTDDWGPIRSTIGISSLVRFGMQPARVPDDLVDALKSREDEEGIQLIEPRELEQGDRVRIVEGVMAGYEAIFEARTSKERVSLLLKIANTTARVKVSRHDIEPADWR
jgi:transcriptional antiterminator RfaH